MLRVILNQLKAKAEELLAEDQAGFRLGWSTVEQLFNSQVITLTTPAQSVPQLHRLQKGV